MIQYAPDLAELDAGWDLDDPTGDIAHSPVRGIIHRYSDRLLLTPTMRCPVYCRYCFRKTRVGRHTPSLTDAELENCFEYIRNSIQVREVILTGGDPFTLPDRKLGGILNALRSMPHIDRIRLHTRYPIASPRRISETLCELLTAFQPLFIVVHCNHAAELTQLVASAVQKLKTSGCSLLAQSVLLRRVNDSKEILSDLWLKMLSLGIKPYYLHQLDRAPGTGHFHVPIAIGRKILAESSDDITGLAVPKYMLEIPGGRGKIEIGGHRFRIVDESSGHYRLRSNCGEWVDYFDRIEKE